MPRSLTTSDETRPFRRVEYRLSTRSDLTTTVADSSRMGRIRQRGTSGEVAVQRGARAVGVRLSVTVRKLPGSPDLVNLHKKIAVFVHGCFWHAHRGCSRATVPKRNRSFWRAKFRRNRERDRDVAEKLRRLGFRVV